MVWCKWLGHDFRIIIPEEYGGIRITKGKTKRDKNPPIKISFGSETRLYSVPAKNCRHCGLSKRDLK